MPSLPGGRRGAGRGPLRPDAPVLARPGRRRRGDDRARHGAADRWAATTPSWRPTPRCARGDPGLAAGARGRDRRLLRQLRAVLSPSAGPTRALRRAGHRAGADRPLGPRRRRRALLADAAHARGRRARSASSTRAADQGEGRRPARRRVPRRARARPAAAARARRRRARGGRAARAAGRARHVPRLAGGRRRSRAPTPAPTCSCSARGPTRSARCCWRRRRPGLPVVAVDEGGPCSS